MPVFKDGFFTPSAVSWPGWAQESWSPYISDPADGEFLGIKEQQGVGRIDVNLEGPGDHQAYTEVSLMRDLAGTGVDLTDDLWRVTWKFRVNRTNADDILDLYLYLGNFDYYVYLSLQDYVAGGGGLQTDVALYGPDDSVYADSILGVEWDEDSFFYAEINHVMDQAELRLWKASESRPESPMLVITATTPPTDNVVRVDYNWHGTSGTALPVSTYSDPFTRTTTQGDGNTGGIGTGRSTGPSTSAYGLGDGYPWNATDSPYTDNVTAANAYQHSLVYCDGSRVVIPAQAYDSYLVPGATVGLIGQVSFDFYVPLNANQVLSNPAYGAWVIPPEWTEAGKAGTWTPVYVFSNGDGTGSAGANNTGLAAVTPLAGTVVGTFTPDEDTMYRVKLYYDQIISNLISVNYKIWKASDPEPDTGIEGGSVGGLLQNTPSYYSPGVGAGIPLGTGYGGDDPPDGPGLLLDFWQGADVGDSYFDNLEVVALETQYPGVGGRGFLEMDDVIAASGEDVSAGPGSPILLHINGEDVSAFLEWGMSFEQVLGGVGRATLTIQDRSLTYQPECHWDVKIVKRSDGFVLWRGEVISEPEDLPVGFPWRRWVLDCADYNYELPWRLVGAMDGKVWRDIDNLGDYVNVDPFAQSLATDQQTVQVLFEHYIRINGEEIDTSTYVYKYLENFATIYWAYTDLQQALEDLAAGIATNIQFWVDPDLRFHWVTIPAWQDLAQENVALFADADSVEAPLARGFPESDVTDLMLAPVASVGDDGEIGCRELKFTLDGSSMPEQVYVRGSTGYVYNAPPIEGQETTTTTPPPPVTSPYPPGAAYVCDFVKATKVYYKDSSGLLSGVGGRGYVVVPAGSRAYISKMQWVPWHQAGTPHPDAPTGRFWEILSGPYKGKYIDNDTNNFGYGLIKLTAVPPPSTTPPPPGSPPPPPAVPERCDDGTWASVLTTGGATQSAVLGHTRLTIPVGGEVNVLTGLDATITDRVASGHWRVHAKFTWDPNPTFIGFLVMALYDETTNDVFWVQYSPTTGAYQLNSPDGTIGSASGTNQDLDGNPILLVDGHVYDLWLEGVLEEDLVRFKLFDDALQEPAWTDEILYGAPTGTQWGMRFSAESVGGSGTANITFSELCASDKSVLFSAANVGVGGSGFVGEVTQDPNKRQAYLDAAISSNRGTRDAVGGQVLYRGSRPTLRGTMKVTGGVAADGTDHGAEGWRVGQMVPIRDARLPDFLNDRFFVVQRVAGTLIPTHDLREYVIDWGDGPTSRWSMQSKLGRGSGVGLPPPAIQMVVDTFDLSPAPNTSQVVTAQLVNGSGQPWAVAGKMVQWTLEVYDADGAAVTGEGSIDPEVSMTDANGKARTTLTTGPNLKRVYFVFAEVPVS